MSNFRELFISTNPQLNSVDANWLKVALTNSIARHIPKKKYKSCKDVRIYTMAKS